MIAARLQNVDTGIAGKRRAMVSCGHIRCAAAVSQSDVIRQPMWLTTSCRIGAISPYFGILQTGRRCVMAATTATNNASKSLAVLPAAIPMAYRQTLVITGTGVGRVKTHRAARPRPNAIRFLQGREFLEGGIAMQCGIG